jgi:hypothetical protein
MAPRWLSYAARSEVDHFTAHFICVESEAGIRLQFPLLDPQVARELGIVARSSPTRLQRSC